MTPAATAFRLPAVARRSGPNRFLDCYVGLVGMTPVPGLVCGACVPADSVVKVAS